jgi:hypothetical protein
MLHKGRKKLIIYLEDWQKRMVKDFLGVDCHTYEVEIATPSGSVHKYGVPTDESLKRMYFTDWQIREMRYEAGVVCEFIELPRDFAELEKGPAIMLYGVPID